MKLAEALILRADHQKRIEQLKARLQRNAKVQEGDRPAEDPQELIKELERVAVQLTHLIQGINKTNSSTLFVGQMTLADAIAARDSIKIRHGIYLNFAQAATVTQDRYTKSEVKFKSTVNVVEIQKRADELARDFRELDAKIQAMNWQTELVE